MIFPCILLAIQVNCDMFADDASLNTSDKDTDTVQNELQRSINEASDWCDNNAMILHPAKTKGMLLTARQKHRLRPLHLNLSLKDSHIEQVPEHRHLGVIIDDEFRWPPHISTSKTVSKIVICCHSSDTLWTLLSASYFTMLIFPLT